MPQPAFPGVAWPVRGKGMHLPAGLKGSYHKVRRTLLAFLAIDPFTEAGSLAYSTIFALPAVFIMTLYVASLFYDEQLVYEALYGQVGALVGTDTVQQVQTMVKGAMVQGRSWITQVAGIAALVLSATSAFVALQRVLNKVWRVKARPGRRIWRYLVQRLISLGLIAALGFLLLVSLVVDAALVGMAHRFGSFLPGAAWLDGAVGILVSFGVVTLIFASVFKYLPDVKVPWHTVWVGALVTAVSFSLGKYVIGTYLATARAASAFGAGGAVIIMLLWIYYSALLMIFGAQYTQVTARLRKVPIVPVRDSELQAEG